MTLTIQQRHFATALAGLSWADMNSFAASVVGHLDDHCANGHLVADLTAHTIAFVLSSVAKNMLKEDEE